MNNQFIKLAKKNNNIELILVDQNNNDVLNDSFSAEYFYNYNPFHYEIPNGYTAHGENTGIIKIEATENKYIIWYRIKRQASTNSSIQINYLYRDNLVKSSTANGEVNNGFDKSQYLNNIPSGYSLLNISNGSNINTFTDYPQYLDIELIQSSTLGTIIVTVKDQNSGNEFNSYAITGQAGQSFDLSPYMSKVPNDYFVSNVDNKTSTFNDGVQIITIECSIKSTQITINYSMNLPSQTVTEPIGTSFNIQPYIDDATNQGYNYDGTSTTITQFTDSNQSITINIDKPAPQPQPQPNPPSPTTVSWTVQAEVSNGAGGYNTIAEWHNCTEPINTKISATDWAAQQGETNITDSTGDWFTVDPGSPSLTWTYPVPLNGVLTIYYIPTSNPNNSGGNSGNNGNNSGGQTTNITRPIDWEDTSDSLYTTSGGSQSITAPDGTATSVEGLEATYGISVTPPFGYDIKNDNDIINFNSSTSGEPIILLIKKD